MVIPTTHMAFTGYLPCRHLSIQVSVTWVSKCVHTYLIRTSHTPNVQLVPVVSMVSVSMLTYPPNLKITLIITKNGTLTFGMRADYSVKCSMRRERTGILSSNICRSAVNMPHFFPTGKSLPICIDLRGSRSEVGGAGGGKLFCLPEVNWCEVVKNNLPEFAQCQHVEIIYWNYVHCRLPNIILLKFCPPEITQCRVVEILSAWGYTVRRCRNSVCRKLPRVVL